MRVRENSGEIFESLSGVSVFGEIEAAGLIGVGALVANIARSSVMFVNPDQAAELTVELSACLDSLDANARREALGVLQLAEACAGSERRVIEILTQTIG